MSFEELKKHVKKVKGLELDEFGNIVKMPHDSDYIPPVQDPKIGKDVEDENKRVVGDILLHPYNETKEDGIVLTTSDKLNVGTRDKVDGLKLDEFGNIVQMPHDSDYIPPIQPPNFGEVKRGKIVGDIELQTTKDEKDERDSNGL